MSTKKKQAGLVLGVGLILSAFRTALIAYTMEKNSVESDTYYLPDGHIWVTVFSVVSVVFALLIMLLALRSTKRAVVLDHKGSAGPASLVLGFLLIGASIIYAVSSEAAKLAGGGMMKIVIALAVLSAAAFIILGFRSNSADTSKSFLAVLSVFPIVFSAFRLLSDFIQTSATPLASSGAYHILGLSAVLLYFLAEGKSYVSDSSAKIYFLFGYLSVFFLLVYAVPNLILHCFGVFMFDYGAAFSAVDIGIAVYVSTRMMTAKIKKENIAVTAAA